MDRYSFKFVETEVVSGISAESSDLVLDWLVARLGTHRKGLVEDLYPSITMAVMGELVSPRPSCVVWQETDDGDEYLFILTEPLTHGRLFDRAVSVVNGGGSEYELHLAVNIKLNGTDVTVFQGACFAGPTLGKERKIVLAAILRTFQDKMNG